MGSERCTERRQGWEATMTKVGDTVTTPARETGTVRITPIHADDAGWIYVEVEGAPLMRGPFDSSELKLVCSHIEVAAGESWCETHDSAAPCPFGEVLAKVARGVAVHRLEYPELELLSVYYTEKDDLTLDEDGHWGRVELELNARDLADHDDPRVRESVGVYDA